MANLTPKQEAFCLAYIETGNGAEAYRTSYDAANMKPGSIYVQVSKMLDDPKIALRLEELRAELAEKHSVTVEKIRDMLLEDRKFARKLETPAAAISATMGLAKLYGHLTDKVDTKVTVTALPSSVDDFV